jgi:quercetin 2,3-dioxygenase
MSIRSIKHIIPAEKVNMGGHLLDQPLPSEKLENLDPFLLIHHWHRILPGNQRPQELGVGPHPHRGFSPVTFIFKGAVCHQDSLGEKATVAAGGTQWMFAGRGITHSERFPSSLAQSGGELEFIQFWVNAPAAHKMDAPYYQPISLEETPLVIEDKSKIWVVSGLYKGVSGAAPTYSPQLLLRGELTKDGQISIPIPAHFNVLVYVLEGSLKTNGGQMLTKDMGVYGGRARLTNGKNGHIDRRI